MEARKRARQVTNGRQTVATLGVLVAGFRLH